MSHMKASDRLRRMKVLFMAQGGCCAHCWEPLSEPEEVRLAKAALPQEKQDGPDDPSLDHVIPRSRGGANALGNLLLTHRRCNELRGDGKLPGPAKRMRQRVLGWLELQYGRVPQAEREAA